jgi:DNA adenine methylase
VKPLLKWAGGKSWVLKSYVHMLPDPADIDTYFEPFLGGAAVATRYIGKTTCVLSDANARLVQMYNGVRDSPDVVVRRLEELTDWQQRPDGMFEANPQVFENVRAAFNAYEASAAERAAQLIYLNKTDFNGLYRENRKGEFNAPMGKFKTPPCVCDEENIQAWSRTMNDRGTAFFHADFEKLFMFAKPGTFYFLDPPYVPVSDTANFSAYTASGFSSEDQIRLAHGLALLDHKGAKFLLTNAAEALPLYQDWHVTVAPVSRSINSKGAKRGKVDEILVTNYPVWDAGAHVSDSSLKEHQA